MSDDKQVQFLPFHALNEFMNDDYRLNVIQTTLNGLPHLAPELKKSIDQLTKQLVKVPGFRNPVKAPVYLKIKPFIEAFEKQPKIVATTLSAWASLKSELQKQIYDILDERQWELLPIEADRSKLPGFLIVWPENETFDTIYNAYKEKYPDLETTNDDVSLMTVWISGRLPYTTSQTKDENGE